MNQYKVTDVRMDPLSEESDLADMDDLAYLDAERMADMPRDQLVKFFTVAELFITVDYEMYEDLLPYTRGYNG